MWVQYDKVAKLVREFEPYKNLWITVADWQVWYDSWNNEPLTNIDPEAMEANVTASFRTMHKVCVNCYADTDSIIITSVNFEYYNYFSEL